MNKSVGYSYSTSFRIKDLKAENKELKAQLTDVQKEIGIIKKLAIGFGFGIGIIAIMLIILLVR